MRKTVLILIALFTIGEMCKAQTLPAKRLQMPDGKTAVQNAKKAPKKIDVDTQGTDYWVQAVSTYDEWGTFEPGGAETPVAFQTSMVQDGDTIILNDLISYPEWYTVTDKQAVKGVYDSESKTINVKAKGWDSTTPEPTNYYKLGDINLYGSNYTVVLFSGKTSSEPDESGQYAVTIYDDLVFDVNDDFTKITPRTEYGAYAITKEPSGWDGSYSGAFVDWYLRADICKMPDATAISLFPDTLKFSGQSVTVGAKNSKYLYLSNYGKSASDLKINVVGDGLQLYAEAQPTIDAGEMKSYQVVFTGQKEGEFEGSISFTDDNGMVAKSIITADVAAAPDFSSVVKNGEFTFSFGDYEPYVVTDTITGSPVAVSTNVGNGTYSDLLIYFDVPENQVGTLSWKGISNYNYADGVRIELDDYVLFSNSYSHGFSGVGVDDISNFLVVSAGSHMLKFVNSTMNDWNGTGFKSYFYDLDLELSDISEHNAALKSDALDFGEAYFDKLSINKTMQVNLVNLGSADLKVNEIVADGDFSGIVPENTVGYTEELPVDIVFNGSGVGEKTGNVVIKTNAGDFTVACKAVNKQIPYDYSPIVDEGTFSFNTSEEHPFQFIVDSNTASSSIAGLEVGNKEITSWIEASFDVEGDNPAVLSWTGVNSCEGPYTMMGISQWNDRVEITIDGGNMHQYAGYEGDTRENATTDSSSSTWDAADLTLDPGRHIVRFEYVKHYTDPEGGADNKDRFDLSHLALTTASGIENVMDSNKSINYIQIYDASGRLQHNYQPGLNLVRKVFTDGTVSTQKVYMK